jgi:hypothetical protein
MRTSMRVKHFLVPTLLTLAALGLGTGCSSTKDALKGGTCGGDLSARAEVLGQSVTDLETLNVSVSASVAHACYQIAKDLGSPNTAIADATGSGDAGASTGAAVPSSQVTTNCDEAGKMIKAQFDAAATGSVQVSVIAPKCEINASAQLTCQGKCNASVKCSPPDVTAQCDPGHLSGSCDGTCTGKCEVTGSAALTCSGTCNGTCTGDCTGTASSGTGQATTSNGQCNGTCTGECKGSCAAEASATATCGGTCTGSCAVDFKEPSCDIAVKPPSCDAAADCNASCDSSASLNATCTKPAVVVNVTGNTSLKATLEANLPALVQVAAQFKAVATSVTDIAEQTAALGVDLTSNAIACASLVADVTAKASAAASASANVSVSFKASADVSGSAAAGK